MKKLLGLVFLTLASTVSAQSLSPRANAVFFALIKYSAMKQVRCPGGGSPGTACATSPRANSLLLAKIGKWPRWKQWDPWLENSAAFTSNGKDRYVVSVSRRIGRSGSLLVFTELRIRTR